MEQGNSLKLKQVSPCPESYATEISILSYKSTKKVGRKLILWQSTRAVHNNQRGGGCKHGRNKGKLLKHLRAPGRLQRGLIWGQDPNEGGFSYGPIIHTRRETGTAAGPDRGAQQGPPPFPAAAATYVTVDFGVLVRLHGPQHLHGGLQVHAERNKSNLASRGPGAHPAPCPCPYSHRCRRPRPATKAPRRLPGHPTRGTEAKASVSRQGAETARAGGGAQSRPLTTALKPPPA